MQNRAPRTVPGHEGGIVVAGVDGDDAGINIPSVPFYPQHSMGQVIAIGAVAVTSAQMPLNREHCFWSEQNCWIRVGAGAAALDFPFPAGAVFTYTPRTLGADDTISVIQMAALGGNFYIGESERF